MWYSCTYDQDILKMFFKPSWLFAVAPHVKKNKVSGMCADNLYREFRFFLARRRVLRNMSQGSWGARISAENPVTLTPRTACVCNTAGMGWPLLVSRYASRPDRLTALLKPKADIFSRICNLMQIKAESEWFCFIIRVLFYYSRSTVIQTVHPGCDGNLNWRWPIFGLR